MLDLTREAETVSFSDLPGTNGRALEFLFVHEHLGGFECSVELPPAVWHLVGLIYDLVDLALLDVKGTRRV